MQASKPIQQSRGGSEIHFHPIADLVAGLTTGVADIPDANASGVLAGVNPAQGLYAIMDGTPVGALFSRSISKPRLSVC
jgi:MFS superfamily sulfate permease-like transporter